MKNTVGKARIAFIAFGLAALFLPQRVTGQGAAATEVLTNESVVQMVVGKVPKALILTKIQSTSSAFDVTTNALVTLYQSKVPTDAIKAMMTASSSAPSREVLTNDSVVQMVTGRLPRDIVVAKIQSTRTAFDLTAAGLISLNQSKVPQEVMKQMLEAKAQPASASAAPAPAVVSPPSNAGQTTAAAGARGSTAGSGSQDTKSTAAAKKTPAATDKKK